MTTGIPEKRGAEVAEETPGITSTSTPLSRRNNASSPPLPNIYGSPLFSLPTLSPAFANSSKRLFISSCFIESFPCCFPT